MQISLRNALIILSLLCWPASEAHAQRRAEGFTPRKFDEYVLEGDEQWRRLERFARQLRREPGKQAYVIVYASRLREGPGVHYDGESWKQWAWHNLKAQGLREEQFVIVNGGLRERDMIELWITPPGAPLPAPTPTAKEEVVCPSVAVLGDGYLLRHEQPLTFKAHLSAFGVYSFPDVMFNWTVSSGQIVSGQGTDTITVDVSQASDRRITAAVEVVGLSHECKNRDSSTTVVGVVPFKLDEFGRIPTGDLKARLDNLAFYLQRDVALRAHIIIYDGRYGRRGAAKTWAAFMKNYLSNARGLDLERIDLLDGGYREELSGELWLTTRGAGTPPPSPTVDPKYVRPSSRPRA